MPERQYPHLLGHGTHTRVLDQTEEISTRLAAEPDRADLTAGALGVAGESVRVVNTSDDPQEYDDPDLPRMPADAALREIHVEGSPEFPYIWGRFSSVSYAGRPGMSATPLVEAILHTEALRRLSKALGMHHYWGID